MSESLLTIFGIEGQNAPKRAFAIFLKNGLGNLYEIS